MSDDAMRRAMGIANFYGLSHEDTYDLGDEIAAALRDADAAGYALGFEDATRIANTRADRILAALREPSDELIMSVIDAIYACIARSDKNDGSIIYGKYRAALRAAAEWLRENVR